MLVIDYKHNQMAVERDRFVMDIVNFNSVKIKHTKYGILVTRLLDNPMGTGIVADAESKKGKREYNTNSYLIRHEGVTIIRHSQTDEGPLFFTNSTIYDDPGYTMFLDDGNDGRAYNALFQMDLFPRDKDGDRAFYSCITNELVKATAFNLLDESDLMTFRNSRNFLVRYNLQDELKLCNDGKPLEHTEGLFHQLHKISISLFKYRKVLESETDKEYTFELEL